MIQVDRLRVCGSLDESTPAQVIVEIADAHGIELEDNSNFNSDKLERDPNLLDLDLLVEYINERSVPTITNDLSVVARYVNSRCLWDAGSVVAASTYLNNFANRKSLPDNWTYGLQTKTELYNINSTVLYKICRERGMEMGRATTIDQMRMFIGYTDMSIDKIVESLKRTDGLDNAKVSLCNILIKSNQKVDNTSTWNEEKLKIVSSMIDNKNCLMRMVTPTSTEGAIALAAKRYALDISSSSDPLSEYMNLSMGEIRSSALKDYNPLDKEIEKWFKRNPKIYSLNYYFNPRLPKNLYDMKNLKILAEQYRKTEDPYGDMTVAHFTSNFYQGDHPYIKNRETLVNLDDVDTVTSTSIISYGIMSDGVLRALTFDEMRTSLINYGNFTNPFDTNSLLTEDNIRTLKSICEAEVDGNLGEPLEDYESRQRLLDTIINLEYKLKTQDIHTLNFVEEYKSSNRKGEYRDILIKLLNLAMYMRGWKGLGSPYPLSDTYNNENETLERVSCFLQEFKQLESDVKDKIMSLPLLEYKDGSYLPSVDETKGITVGDRIRILTEYDNINSCIRMSSNWLCASSNCYMYIIGIDHTFPIQKLKRIS